MGRNEDRIVEIEREQAKAFNQENLDDVIRFFDKKVVCFSSTQHKRLKGHTALKNTFRYYLNEADKVRYRITQPAVQRYGDTAIVSFYWTVTLRNGRRERKIEGRGTHALVKRRGDWTIVHEHFSRAHHSPEKLQ